MSPKEFYDTMILLNRTISRYLNETDEAQIFKAFTDLGIQIMEADFGFVWSNSYTADRMELVYTSPGLPYTPPAPHKQGRNRRVIESHEPDFVSHVRKRSDVYDVSRYMKSFVIIPISHYARVYGNIVLCFKKMESFPKEKKLLSSILGNTIAQAIAIRRLVASEHDKVMMREEKRRSEFIADAAHELRTPLAIIKGNVDLALRSKAKSISEDVRTFRAIDYEVKHLSGLISDMTLLSNGSNSLRKKIVSSEISIRRILEHTVERCATLTRKKQISIKIGTFSDIHVRGDDAYLDKLFANIIRNAIVYGKKGGYIKISASKAGRIVRIDITDNGIGIPKEGMSNIFQRFYRSAAARAQNSEGTGLGLAIVKWVAEAYGGTVSVTSTEGKGSTFRVSLPIVK